MILYLLYYKKFDDIEEIFGKVEAIRIRDSLVESNFILSKITAKFTETIISKNQVEKLLGIRSDKINFWEFYNCYPIKVGSWILRASGPTSQLALKHEKKYLLRVKTTEAHLYAIQCIETFVAKKKQGGDLKYLPNMETVMNNSMWELWGALIEDSGTEGQEWNSDQI